MLKSFILIPSSDIVSYSNEKEYPFNIFPTVVLIYDKRNTVVLDNLSLSLLYKSDHNSSDNNITINFKCIKNPIKIIIEENKNFVNLKHLKHIKLQNIKELLPFSFDVNNIIISLIKNENLKWKIKLNRKCSKNSFLIYNYKITNETDIKIKTLINIKKPKSVYKIIYGRFSLNSYIPIKIDVIYFNKKLINSTIEIDNNYITRILIFTQEKTLTEYVNSSEDENFFTEDIDLEQQVISYSYASLKI
jgi:hypothetical protein